MTTLEMPLKSSQIVIAKKLDAENTTLAAFNFSAIYIERMQHKNLVQNVI